MTPERKIRIMVAKPGLNGHDRGAKIIARGFRDAGFEVIYTGLHQTPEQIVAAAIEKGADDIVVFGGGIIPEEDIPKLKEAGIREVFAPGTPIEEAVNWVRRNIKPKK
jgi:methylmalonyl-CoA mutase C-terminal domain/subunit